MHFALRLIRLARALSAGRARLALENLALRQQLAVLQRSVTRPKTNDGDGRSVAPAWAPVLLEAEVESEARPPEGRRRIIALIRRMSTENVLWEAPRIRAELAMLGHDVAESTVAKYMVKTRDPKRQQTWRTFLCNHMDVSAAFNFFTVPTLSLKLLYVFVVLSHDRRRIVHFNATPHPTAEWTAQQLSVAFPGHAKMPRYLHRDRDAIYGEAVRNRTESLGIEQVVSARKSPWQSPLVERVIGSIRRECTDHLVPLNEVHLRKILGEDVAYYNESRCHQSLDGDSVHAIPHLGGLHHGYSRAG